MLRRLHAALLLTAALSLTAPAAAQDGQANAPATAVPQAPDAVATQGSLTPSAATTEQPVVWPAQMRSATPHGAAAATSGGAGEATPAQRTIDTAMPQEPRVPAANQPTEAPTAASGAPAVTAPTGHEALLAAIRASLAEPVKGLSDAEIADRNALAKFYAERQAPLWLASGKPSTAAMSVIAAIRDADAWGLSAKDFDVPAFDLSAALPEAPQVGVELLVSAAALKYARYARGGRIPDPRQMSSYLDRDPQLVPPAEVLASLAGSSDPAATLVGYQPQHAGFLRLKDKLAQLRKSAEVADEPVVMPASGPLLAPGKTHADVAILRQRLKAGSAPAKEDGTPGDAQYYDKALEEVVKAYQRDNGMSVDGLVGRNTRAALNGGERRIDEGAIIANMEAWRWMPQDMGDVHVWVNLPEFLVRVVKNGKVIHEERIISGEIDKQTPVFSHELETVVFRPFWGVPESIKVRELLPSLARGSTLSRHGLRIQYKGRDVDPTEVDWSRADIRRYHVYQPPGGGNVLGVVKFLFPNKHQVYMHDTPTKQLFNSSQRTFSHGCMRVRNPMKLAEVVLREDKGWSADKVQSTLDSGPEDNKIQLESKIPVHVTYFTAWVDEDGELKSKPDIYSHEKRIRLALAGRWGEMPVHRDHLLPVEYVRPQVSSPGSNALGDFFQTLFGGF